MLNLVKTGNPVFAQLTLRQELVSKSTN